MTYVVVRRKKVKPRPHYSLESYEANLEAWKKGGCIICGGSDCDRQPYAHHECWDRLMSAVGYVGASPIHRLCDPLQVERYANTGIFP